jgi:hypothetical protein
MICCTWMPVSCVNCRISSWRRRRDGGSHHALSVNVMITGAAGALRVPQPSAVRMMTRRKQQVDLDIGRQQPRVEDLRVASRPSPALVWRRPPLAEV